MIPRNYLTSRRPPGRPGVHMSQVVMCNELCSSIKIKEQENYNTYTHTQRERRVTLNESLHLYTR